MHTNDSINTIIDILEPYTANFQTYSLKKNIFLKNNNNGNNKEKNKKKIILNELNEFNIKYKDKYFWCFYLIKYKQHMYEMVNFSDFSISTNEKIKNIDEMMKSQSLLKDHKIKPNYVFDKLLNSPTIDLECLKALCLFNEINIIYINKKSYYEIVFFDNNKFNLIKENDKNVTCKLDVSKNEIDTLIKNKFKVEKLDKPLKSLSAYKLVELQNICDCINVNTFNLQGKKRTKMELYGLIKKEIF